MNVIAFEKNWIDPTSEPPEIPAAYFTFDELTINPDAKVVRLTLNVHRDRAARMANRDRLNGTRVEFIGEEFDRFVAENRELADWIRNVGMSVAMNARGMEGARPVEE